MSKPFIFLLITCLIWCSGGLNVMAQQTGNSAGWVTLLNKPFDKVHMSVQEFVDSINPKPVAEINAIVAQLEQEKTIIENKKAMARLSLLKANCSRKKAMLFDNRGWQYWGMDALKQGAGDEDDHLVQSACFVLGDGYFATSNLDTGLFYMLKGLELAERLGYDKKILTSHRISASNALYRTANYKKCIEFCTTDIDIETEFTPIAVIADYNNLGLSYLHLKQPDSALFFFKKAAAFAARVHWGVWDGIINGNIGDVLHAVGRDTEAMPYWQKDYDSSMHYQEFNNAALTLAYISKYQFEKGEQQKAISQLRWAEFTNLGDPINLVRVYNIQAACYRKLGMHDTADLYWQKYYSLADSLNQVTSRNNFNIVKLRLDFEINSNEVKLLKKARSAETVRRNLLIAALLSLLITGVLLYNRQRLKIKLAQQEKAIAEAAVNIAREQLLIFTQTLLEKNSQIEQLTASVQQQAAASNDELIHQTLLTDYDWNRFKELFEKIHPGFFTSLKNLVAGITQSEMRLAALIRLNLDNKQMASMQGISVSSLRGNKTRLRQKLNVAGETGLEELIKQL